MTLLEKAVAELHRQGLSMVGVRRGKVFIGAWNRDLGNVVDIEVHPDQVKELAEDYEKSMEIINQ